MINNKNQSRSYYCEECKYLNVTERDQVDNRRYHICNKYKEIVRHFGHHPHISRLDICIKEDSKDNKYD